MSVVIISVVVIIPVIMIVTPIVMTIITAVVIPAIGGAGAEAHGRNNGEEQEYLFHGLSAFFPG